MRTRSLILLILPGLLIAGLLYFLLRPKHPSLLPYLPSNAAFAANIQPADWLQLMTKKATQAKERFGLSDKMLKRISGSPEACGLATNQPLLMFGNYTSMGAGYALFLPLENQELFNEFIEATRLAGSSIETSGDIRFTELQTGCYISWNKDAALLSYQLSAGETYLMNIWQGKTSKPVTAWWDESNPSSSFMLKPALAMEMWTADKPNTAIMAVGTLLPRNLMLTGTISASPNRLTMNAVVKEGQAELKKLFNDKPAGLACSDDAPKSQNLQLYLQLSLKPEGLRSLSAIGGNEENPLLSLLNGNAKLSKADGENDWELLLGTNLNPQETVTFLAKQGLPQVNGKYPLFGLGLEMQVEQCLRIRPENTIGVSSMPTQQSPLFLFATVKAFPAINQLINPDQFPNTTLQIEGSSASFKLELSWDTKNKTVN